MEKNIHAMAGHAENARALCDQRNMLRVLPGVNYITAVFSFILMRVTL